MWKKSEVTNYLLHATDITHSCKIRVNELVNSKHEDLLFLSCANYKVIKHTAQEREPNQSYLKRSPTIILTA